MSKDPQVTITKPASEFLVRDKDYGGYRAGHCFVCGQHGWLDVPQGQPNGITHTPDCPVGQALS